MNNTYKRYSSCRFCSRQELVELLDFGYSAPANAFLKKDDKDNEQYPLVLSQCRSCGCTQLLDTVPGEVLFKNYSYSSSTIKSLVNHFESYSKTIPIKPNSRILEIGSNDGVLLQFFKQQGYFVLGVEPAENLAKLANDKGLETISVFFNELTAKDILNKYGKFDIITCNNCFAHIDDIHSVIKGIKILLKDDGYYVFENAYLLDTINKLYFDQCYFEHIFYHSVKPLNSLFERHNLEIFNIERNEIQGGTIRVFVSFPGVFINKNKNKFAIDSYIEQEEKAGLYSISTYNNFKYSLETLKAQLWDYIYSRSTSNKRVSCSAYGAAAKFTTFANFFGINNLLSYVVDDSPPKQNLYTPDSRIPIVNSEYFKKNPTDICIITAWNFADSIIKNNEWYTKQGGKFIICMPEVKIV